MTRLIVAVPDKESKDGYTEFPTPDNGVIAYKTQFGTIRRYPDEAHSIEQVERRERGLCLYCGEFPAVEDLGTCESCRQKVRAMYGKIGTAMRAYGGGDPNWSLRTTWETTSEHAARIAATCPCCKGKVIGTQKWCDNCMEELRKQKEEVARGE